MTHQSTSTRARLHLLLIPCLLGTAALGETPAEKDQRMAWWREARFGMFIHWGLYAVPAGEWGNRRDHAEWIRTTAQIPLKQYDQFLAQFNPVKFDADAWVRMAKDAGMRYIVITSKHHDGFALFDSQVSDFDVMATPFKRDILKELSEACRKHGLKMCWYHSIMDWHHPDYLPRREWETDRPAAGADFKKFTEYLHAQVTELLTNYGPIGVLWFDGEWEATWSHEYGQPLYDLCRKLQPGVIVNNRVDKGRGGMAGLTEDAKYAGDFGTPEQEVPRTGIPGVDWESCMTMNDHWGYNKNDKNFKSSRELIRLLVDIASKGGNFLLNIGPTAEGEFPAESVERLAAMGRWMKINGDAIYGTTAGPFTEGLPWGRCTAKAMGGDTRLFLHVFDWPADAKLTLGGLGNDMKGARVLAGNGEPLRTERKESDLVIHLPAQMPDADCTVIALDVVGRPIVYESPKISAPADIFVNTLTVEIKVNSAEMEIRCTQDGSEPTANSAVYKSPLRLSDTTTVKARAFHRGKAVSSVAAAEFKKVPAWPAVEGVAGTGRGLRLRTYTGEWDRLPDFAALTPTRKAARAGIELEKEDRAERQGLVFAGLLRVATNDAYVFALTSDDGSRLYIDDKLVVDNDGLHEAQEKRGVAPLAAGHHALRVEYFNKTGGSELKLLMAPVGATPGPISPEQLASPMGEARKDGESSKASEPKKDGEPKNAGEGSISGAGKKERGIGS
ncbi:MAG: alpha-L-fucosidase [Phycisphaerales bacterium]|nr:alpha-L-fucosidase [Phycisphaerales bacterium]